MNNKNNWLYILLEKFKEKKYIDESDYSLFGGITELCPFLFKKQLDEIFISSCEKFNLDSDKIEKCIKNIQKNILTKEYGSRYIAFYMLFDRNIKNKSSDRKKNIKIIFYEIMKKISY